MRLSLISTNVIVTFLTLLLLFFAFLLLWTDQIGPVSPSPSAVVVSVQGQELYSPATGSTGVIFTNPVIISVQSQELHPLTQPVRVKVKKGEPVEVKVQVYYQEQLKEPGEFTYQWCFNPPVNENRYCSITGYRREANDDYKPKSSDEQALTITIRHNFLRTSTITLLFTPE